MVGGKLQALFPIGKGTGEVSVPFPRVAAIEPGNYIFRIEFNRAGVICDRPVQVSPDRRIVSSNGSTGALGFVSLTSIQIILIFLN